MTQADATPERSPSRLRGRLDEMMAAGELDLALPGSGATRWRHEALLAVGRADLSLGRLVEAHTDAVAILAEAGVPPRPDCLYGVWASERPGARLEIRSGPDGDVIAGVKEFCTGVDLCDAALVTAFRPESDGGPVLVDLDLRSCRRSRAVHTTTHEWASVAFASTSTGSMLLDPVRIGPEDVVGDDGWYLRRAGFWSGAVGPAAVWAGGAIGLVDHAIHRDPVSAHVAAHLGALRSIEWQLHAILAAAADDIDADPHDDAGTARARALMARHLVERAATEVLDRYGRAVGPGPLAFDAPIARRYAELALYIRQDHAESDLAAIEAEFRSSSAGSRSNGSRA